MEQTVLAYVAGLVDGEGHICLIKDKRDRNPYYTPSVGISNTNTGLLYWVRSTTRLGIVIPYGDSRISKGWKPAFKLHLRQGEIKELLPQIIPYLIVKKTQAELIMEFLGIRKNKYSELTGEEITLREVIYQELLELNKRGV